jgi:autotransporter passenger strand-loop-strand repeat protein
MRVGRSDALNDGSPETLAIRTSVAAGTLVISTGGTAISGFIGGTAIVEAGGVALGLVLAGVLNLSSGGTAIRADIQSLEAVENVFAGATDLSAAILCSQNIFSGGEAEDASVFGSLAV